MPVASPTSSVPRNCSDASSSSSPSYTSKRPFEAVFQRVCRRRLHAPVAMQGEEHTVCMQNSINAPINDGCNFSVSSTTVSEYWFQHQQYSSSSASQSSSSTSYPCQVDHTTVVGAGDFLHCDQDHTSQSEFAFNSDITFASAENMSDAVWPEIYPFRSGMLQARGTTTNVSVQASFESSSPELVDVALAVDNTTCTLHPKPIPITAEGVVMYFQREGSDDAEETIFDEDANEVCVEDELAPAEEALDEEGLEEEDLEECETDRETDEEEDNDPIDSGLDLLLSRIADMRRRLTELGQSGVAPDVVLDETIVRLRSMLEHERARVSHGGLDSEAIEANTVTHTLSSKPGRCGSSKADTTQHQCMVCLEEFEISDKVRILPCFHRYHCSCIDTWFLRDSRCPICKHDISMDATAHAESEAAVR
mmetsp:Transcript_98787/g.156239  ORF Transcript_98787/g.156239 Transcript_98787/m.156239 type:complete len:422 (+) Transcript_98787:42-1307(+)